MEVAPELHAFCNNGRREPARSATIGERNNRDTAAAPPEEEAPTMHDSFFNPNKAYCLG
ncbi:hypothetical protein DEO72_LG10g771 [Vigna unguiculata]|uniref:Uncharacterized protein n=1 Tax=Vigna unguiculata TaxID=3917 RepID=A0A4D6N6V8_VIGUN|nr:hypothetical protein DEO72_LG10g771 [Vigna unguiculata]